MVGTLNDRGAHPPYTAGYKIGFVYQFHHLLPEFSALGIVPAAMIAGRGRRAAEVRGPRFARRLSASPRGETHLPGEAVRRQQQRVAIARALANQPKLLLADEPTGNVDVHTSDKVFSELLKIVRDQGVAALIATHNPGLAGNRTGSSRWRMWRVLAVTRQ